MKKSGNKSATANRRIMRRRVWPLWIQPTAWSVLVALVVGGAGGGALWSWHSGAVDAAISSTVLAYRSLNRAAGLVVDEVLVDGREETPRALMLSVLGVKRGDLVLEFDLTAARYRLEEIGWIASARVERHLPDTIRVSIVERVPVAIWQRKGDFVLVDASGVVIGRDGIDRYRGLKVVVGDDAPEHAQALMDILSEHPALMARVKAAVRSGGRRWNLRMDNGIDIRLPETDAFIAWDRLAKYEAQHKLLARDIGSIDLRLPDRVVVKVKQSETEKKFQKGSRT
tara:strand:- start:1893 stop:2744 length:852 start_codon:yes stop_codon:yes gene_type:complete